MGGVGARAPREVYRAHVSRGRVALNEMLGAHVEASSHGSWIVTEDGRRFLNCAGYGVFLLGATHPRVVERVIEQVRSHPLSSRVLLDLTPAEAAGRLVAHCPAGLEKVHFVGSGAEAVETAIKLARADGCRRLVTTIDGYHGKTTGALSLTARPVFQDPFRPLLADVVAVPYGDPAALEQALDGQDRSMVIVEPIQGEAGVVVPPDGYLCDVQDVCRRHDAVLVVDEVLTGLGRLGTWFASTEAGIEPDVLLVGKGLSGGVVPVAAAVVTRRLYEVLDKDPFLHTSTFAASPVATAAAAAALEVMEDEDVVERAAMAGHALMTSLRRAVEGHPLVVELRGRGLLVGLHLRDPGVAGELMLELIDRHVVVNHSLNRGDVLRLTPPATLTTEEIDVIGAAVEDGLAAVLRREEEPVWRA